MNDIEKLLSTGDLRTTGKSEKVVKLVISNPDLLTDVVNVIPGGNPGASMRACDALEKISRDNPDWLKPFKRQLLTEIAAIDQKEVRWHLAQILPRLDLSSKERARVYELMQAYLEDHSSIVKTFAMQTLTDIAMQDHSYIDKVRSQVKRLMNEGSPAMKSRGKKLLATLDGE